MKAQDFLKAGLTHMQDRAETYDKPQGERSMGATVAAFKAITGISMSEEQGWLFMLTLKSVRSQQGGYKSDNYEDGAAYFGLMGEAAHAGRFSVIMPDAVTGNWPASADERMEPIMQNGNDGDHYDELDMSDPQNWKAGDILECVTGTEITFASGNLYTVLRMRQDKNQLVVEVDLDDIGVHNGLIADYFKWHSRPSAEEIIQDGIVTQSPGDVFIQTEDGETARYSAAGYAASKEQ